MLRLKSGDIQPGQALPFHTYDEVGRLFLRRGFVIDSPAQLRRLLARGLYRDLNEAGTEPAPADTTWAPARTQSAFTWLALVQEVLDELLHAPQRVDFVPRLQALAQRVQRVCERDADAALASIVHQQTGRIGPRRMLHSAILAEVMLANTEHTPEQRHAVVCAALTMNITLMDLQETLHHQQSPLTDYQRQIVLGHPARAVARLRELGVSDTLWLELVQQHHEVPDGTGYPAGLSGTDLPRLSQALALVDRFGAMATGRAYREPRLPNVVLKDILADRGKAVSAELAGWLIRAVGIYPPGSLVQLADDDLAIVVRRTSHVGQPVVRCVQTSQGQRIAPPRRRLTSEPGSAVQGLLPLSRLPFQIDPATFWPESFPLDQG